MNLSAINTPKPTKAQELFYALKELANTMDVIEMEEVKLRLPSLTASSAFYLRLEKLEEVGAIERIMDGNSLKRIAQIRFLKDHVSIPQGKRGRKLEPKNITTELPSVVPVAPKVVPSSIPEQTSDVVPHSPSPVVQPTDPARSMVFIDENQRSDQIKPMDGKMIVGNSVAMQILNEIAKKAAKSNCNILITGESGTGKELLARDIHDRSRRAAGPFIPINCGALTESLPESELFGHEKGSFTGAIAKHCGVFEQAEGGTIFLDEIGEISPAVQAKLLRVLENKEVRRVGGNKSIKVDVRVLSATNANIRSLVTAKKFREDLYYRINTVELHIPPLRERMEDISVLANHFMGIANQENGLDVNGMSNDAFGMLMSYPWPGNIRELRNTIERMMVLGAGGEIGVDDIPLHIKESSSTNTNENEKPTLLIPERGMSMPLAVAEYRHALAVEALKRTTGNVSQAAKLLGINRSYLSKIINKGPTSGN